jgi:hypothetical protein
MINTQKWKDEERTKRIVGVAEEQMKQESRQRTFGYPCAFVYASKIEGDGRYVVGLLQTNPGERPFYTARITRDDDPLPAIGWAQSLLDLRDCSVKFYKYVSEYQSREDINFDSIPSGLIKIIEICIERQDKINAYARGLSYLNEQVHGGKTK